MEVGTGLSIDPSEPANWLVIIIALLALGSTFRLLATASELALLACRRSAQASSAVAVLVVFGPDAGLHEDTKILTILAAFNCWLMVFLFARRWIPRAVARRRAQPEALGLLDQRERARRAVASVDDARPRTKESQSRGREGGR
jgi:hypothetical protein